MADSGAEWIDDDEKRFAHRECDFSLFLSLVLVLAAGGPAWVALLPSGVRPLGAAVSGALLGSAFLGSGFLDSGGFFRRRLGGGPSKELRRPVTNSLREARELSLLRLFRPPVHHESCGGAGLLVAVLDLVVDMAAQCCSVIRPRLRARRRERRHKAVGRRYRIQNIRRAVDPRLAQLSLAVASAVHAAIGLTMPVSISMLMPAPMSIFVGSDLFDILCPVEWQK